MSKSRTRSMPEAAAASPAESPSRQHEQAARKAKAIDPEVLPKPKRRTFTVEYKTRILREASECKPGDLGALLRREGLYSSHLSKWRAQGERGALAGLTPKKRGRKRNENQALADENKQLRQRNKWLEGELHKAQVVIDVQKKVAMLLGVPMAASKSEEL